MITVTVNGASVAIEQASEGWLNRTVAEARRSGTILCIKVNIDTPAAQIVFSTAGCPRGAGVPKD